MTIKNIFEKTLFFALTYGFLSDKNLTEMVFSSNDKIKWQSAEDNFRRVRLNYYNQRTKISDQSRRKKNMYYDNQIDDISDTQIDSQYTTVDTNQKDYFKEEKIDSSIVDDSEQFDNIRHVCDTLTWNVLKNDSDVFILTKYWMLDKIVCSINDIEPDRSYEYMCQYGQYFSLYIKKSNKNAFLCHLMEYRT